MSEINITVEGGTSVRLKTEGKYCDRDILVIAKKGGIDLPKLNNPALAEQIVDGYEAINSEGAVIVGTNPYEMAETDETVAEQSDLIEQIAAVLRNKGAGGNADIEDMLVGGIAKETLTEYSNERVTEIRDYTFSDFTGLQAVNLPNVENIGPNGFSGTRLQEVSLPKCETVGTYAFNMCRYLTKADFPALITAGDYMFNNDVLLTEVNMPVVTTVKRQAFYYCSSLARLDFPSLETIYLYAFTNCGRLETVIIRTPTVCSLQNVNAFTGTKIASGAGYIYVPKTLSDGSDGVEAYKASTNWSSYESQFRAIEDYPEICEVVFE